MRFARQHSHQIFIKENDPVVLYQITSRTLLDVSPWMIHTVFITKSRVLPPQLIGNDNIYIKYFFFSLNKLTFSSFLALKERLWHPKILIMVKNSSRTWYHTWYKTQNKIVLSQSSFHKRVYHVYLKPRFSFILFEVTNYSLNVDCWRIIVNLLV